MLIYIIKTNPFDPLFVTLSLLIFMIYFMTYDALVHIGIQSQYVSKLRSFYQVILFDTLLKGFQQVSVVWVSQ